MEMMKRRAYNKGSEGRHSTGLQQLEGLPLRLIALKLSNPGPLAASCRAAHSSINSDVDFDVEWFLRWVHVLAPLRPWQYAAVAWQRLGGPHTTAEQLCTLILRISTAKRQNHPQPKSAQPAGQAQHTAGQPPQQQQQQQQEQAVPAQQQHGQVPPEQHGAQADAAAPPAAKAAQQPLRFSPMPHNVPLPSVERHARKLLAKGHALSALAALCPGQQWLLHQYAAAAGNVQLLQQIIHNQADARGFGPYPLSGMSCSGGGCRTVNVAQLAAYTALKAGHSSVLASILLTGGAGIKSRHYQVAQLFRYAVRHSNAQCVQQLLDFVPWMEFGNPKLAPWPQHLAMAAGRVDPWASEVVSLLLRVMSPKLLAAKYMGPVCAAACRTGHMPVLMLLVQRVLEMPKGHLLVLMKAAAAAGNRSVWEQLLGVQQQQQPAAAVGSGNSSAALQAAAAGASSSSREGGGWAGGVLSFFSRWFAQDPTLAPAHSEQQQQQQQQQQQGRQQQQGVVAASAAVLPQLPLQLLAPGDCLGVLLDILDSMCPSSLPKAIGQEVIRLAADPDKAAMADAWWQLQDTTIQGAVSVHLADWRVFPWASYGSVQQLLATAPAGKIVWLAQHGVLPELPPTWVPSPAACEGLMFKLQFCLRFGQRESAAVLWRLAQQLRIKPSAAELMQGCIDGAVHAAAAAQNLKALRGEAAFAEYARAVAAFAQTEVKGLEGKVDPTDSLLLALTSAWNAAVLLDARGLLQQLGVPLQQHLQLCAAAVVPAMLQHIPQITCRDVQQLLAAVSSFDAPAPPVPPRTLSQDAQQHQQQLQFLQHMDQLLPTVAQLVTQLGILLRARGVQFDELVLVVSLGQLACLWVFWRTKGPGNLVVPFDGKLAVLPIAAAPIWPETSVQVSTGAWQLREWWQQHTACQQCLQGIPSAQLKVNIFFESAWPQHACMQQGAGQPTDVRGVMSTECCCCCCAVSCCPCMQTWSREFGERFHAVAKKLKLLPQPSTRLEVSALLAAAAANHDAAAAPAGSSAQPVGSTVPSVPPPEAVAIARRNMAAAAAVVGSVGGAVSQVVARAFGSAAEGDQPAAATAAAAPGLLGEVGNAQTSPAEAAEGGMSGAEFTAKELSSYATLVSAMLFARGHLLNAETAGPAAAVAAGVAAAAASLSAAAAPESDDPAWKEVRQAAAAGAVASDSIDFYIKPASSHLPSLRTKAFIIHRQSQAAAAGLRAQCGIMPLWQYAVLALPPSDDRRQRTRADLGFAVEATLQALPEGSATPAFLLGSSTVSAAGARRQEPAAAVAAPAAPQEREMLAHIMGDADWLRHTACYWFGALHRPDAMAWALHPQQEHLWACPAERLMTMMLLRGCTSANLLPYRWNEPLLIQAHEQQLRQHRQQLGAGVTEGFHALPYFAAGAADAATSLLAGAEPVYISRIVMGVSGSSSAAHVELVKSCLAAVLAGSRAQLAAVDDEDWLNVDVGAVRKAMDVGDADLLALLVMLDGRAARPVDQPLFDAD
jgi:hypothetical protein